MKGRNSWLLAITVLFLLLAGAEPSLATVDRTATLGASAAMGAVTSLSAQAKNISDNANATAVNFGTINVLTNKLGPQYVLITVQSNVLGSTGAWELETYTNNFAAQPSTTTWGYQYGGMVDTGADGGHRVPMVWQAYRSTTTVTDPPADLSNWMYLKDKKDIDIPGTVKNESWATAHSEGYTNIAYGGVGYLMVVEPGTTGVLDTNNSFAIYLGGQFGVAASDTYSTTLNFDLYHE